ncbi:MAG TPA: PfaD family polyunsaturated fatty acid/polyketide biosynthesis protein [Acidiferrobacterales bacterium]|jgi:trans-AT polyketide synthase/acyltransferase/oxidoreductase domain-containing protein
MEALQTDKQKEYPSEAKMNGPLENASLHFERAAERLGSASFKREYGLKYAYLSGAMYRGIASKELVVSMGKAGLLGFLGTGGLSLDRIRSDIESIQKELSQGQAYGMNLICDVSDPSMEMKTVEVYLEKGIQRIEASAFMQITPALVYYRLKGLEKKPNGTLECRHKILAKVSRPEVAKAFMSPAPERIVTKLLSQNKITPEQAQWAESMPMANDICVEADSGGHTDQGVATVLLPAIQSLRKEMGMDERNLRIGLAGGIGTPQAVAAAFAMGADFVLTGSINQCTVESGMSSAVKDLLQDINVQDTAYAPAGDMFEMGSKIQVLKKGLFFPARANRLFMLYSHYNALEEIPETIRKQLEDKYFKKSFETIWQETKTYLEGRGKTEEIEKAQRHPKYKMALVFRWYFGYSIRLAFSGDDKNQVDYQVHTGPALGAFNQWVKGTEWESWRARHVDQIAYKLMKDAAILLVGRLQELMETEL